MREQSISSHILIVRYIRSNTSFYHTSKENDKEDDKELMTKKIISSLFREDDKENEVG